MADRRGGPLAQIEADLLNDRPLSSLLEKCILLGGRAGSERLRDWARSELNGYAGRDGVPDYRHVHAPVMAMITNRAGYNGMPTRIDPDAFSDQIRDIFLETAGDLEDAILPFGIGRLEGLASKGTDTHHLSTPFSSVMADMLNQHFVHPGSHVREVYWSVSNDAILGILSRVRTALVDLVAELITLTPQDQDVPDKQAADRAVQLVVTGDGATIHFGDSRAGDTVTHNSGSQYNFGDINGNVAAGSSGFTQNYSAGFDVTNVRKFADRVTEIGGLLGLDTSQQTELSTANTELHEAIEAPEADKGRARQAWDAVMGIVKLGTNKAVVTAAISLGNQAANDLGAAIHHLHP